MPEPGDKLPFIVGEYDSIEVSYNKQGLLCTLYTYDFDNDVSCDYRNFFTQMFNLPSFIELDATVKCVKK